jgi:hypothetical protein
MKRLLIASAALAFGLGAAFAQTIVVSPEATTEFQTYITTEKVKDVDVDVDVVVGTALPETVVLSPVPEVVVTKSPELKGYRFAVVKGKTVIVEPSSTKIVAVVGG